MRQRGRTGKVGDRENKRMLKREREKRESGGRGGVALLYVSPESEMPGFHVHCHIFSVLHPFAPPHSMIKTSLSLQPGHGRRALVQVTD